VISWDFMVISWDSVRDFRWVIKNLGVAFDDPSSETDFQAKQWD
jgi:hypothetical protein